MGVEPSSKPAGETTERVVQVPLPPLPHPDPAKRGRNAEFFVFSKHFVGGDSTGYVDSQVFAKVEPQLDLAAAVAISGAAVSSSMGRTALDGWADARASQSAAGLLVVESKIAPREGRAKGTLGACTPGTGPVQQFELGRYPAPLSILRKRLAGCGPTVPASTSPMAATSTISGSTSC